MRQTRMVNGARVTKPVAIPRDAMLAPQMELQLLPKEGVEVYRREWLVEKEGETWVIEPDKEPRKAGDRYLVDGEPGVDDLLDVVVVVTVPFVPKTSVVDPSGKTRVIAVKMGECGRMGLDEYKAIVGHGQGD